MRIDSTRGPSAFALLVQLLLSCSLLPATSDAVAWTPAALVLETNRNDEGSGMYVADLNGDGFDDVIVLYQRFQVDDRWEIQLLGSTGDGDLVDISSSMMPGGVPSTTHGRDVVFADFNGDSRTDAFIADHGYDAPPFPGAPNVLMLSDDTTLSDASRNLPASSGFTHSATAGDIDDDGDVDLFVGNMAWSDDVPDSSKHKFLVNDGTGSFTANRARLPAELQVWTGGVFTTSHLFDADGDGDLDLFLGSAHDVFSNVLATNDGAGNFSLAITPLPAKAFGDGTIVVDSTSADIDRDGDQDLILSNTQTDPFYVGRKIQILLNDGMGVFRDGTEARMPVDPMETTAVWDFAIHPRDIDGDCDVDLIAVSLDPNSNRLLVQNDDKTFLSMNPNPLPIAHSDGNFYVWSPLDADGDGGTDVVGLTGWKPANDWITQFWIGRSGTPAMPCPEPGPAGGTAVMLVLAWLIRRT